MCPGVFHEQFKKKHFPCFLLLFLRFFKEVDFLYFFHLYAFQGA